jgi:hypothetical protein
MKLRKMTAKAGTETQIAEKAGTNDVSLYIIKKYGNRTEKSRNGKRFPLFIRKVGTRLVQDRRLTPLTSLVSSGNRLPQGNGDFGILDRGAAAGMVFFPGIGNINLRVPGGRISGGG